MYMETENMIAGFVSGSTQTFIGHPLDTLKVWKQQQHKRCPIMMFELFKGLKYPLITSSFVTSVQFVSYMEVSKQLGFLSNPALSDAAGGAVSGVITGICVSPIDKYKIALQTKSNSSRFGLLSCWMREIPAGAVYFGTYSVLRQADVPVFASGSISGAVSWLLTYPMDVIKTQIQSGESRDIRHAIKKMGAGELRIWSGLGFCLSRALLVNGVGFTIFEKLKPVV
jgi:solute carrier family 25 (mitochondrial carnitine/acylcarnitine transporter), member 20/29